MRSSLHTILVCVATLYLVGCDPEPVQPAATKDPRFFAWRIETLRVGTLAGIRPRKIWGTVFSDLYAMGDDSYGGRYAIIHFDGQGWSGVGFHAADGGPVSGYIVMSDAWGERSGDIWFGGTVMTFSGPYTTSAALMLKRSNGTWSQQTLPARWGIGSMAGDRSDNIWAGGDGNGGMFHYDGSGWTEEPLPVPNIPEDQMTTFGIVMADSLVYAIYRSNDVWRGIAKDYFLKRAAGAWSVVDHRSSDETVATQPWGAATLWRSPDGTIFSGGDGLYRRTGSGWTTISSAWAVRSISGSSSSNLIAGGSRANVIYFDGSTVWELWRTHIPPDFDVNAVWYDGTHAVLLCTNGFASIVVYGE